MRSTTLLADNKAFYATNVLHVNDASCESEQRGEVSESGTLVEKPGSFRGLARR